MNLDAILKLLPPPFNILLGLKEVRTVGETPQKKRNHWDETKTKELEKKFQLMLKEILHVSLLVIGFFCLRMLEWNLPVKILCSVVLSPPSTLIGFGFYSIWQGFSYLITSIHTGAIGHFLLGMGGVTAGYFALDQQHRCQYGLLEKVIEMISTKGASKIMHHFKLGRDPEQ